MSEWTEDQKRRFDECRSEAEVEAADANARRIAVEEGSEHTYQSAPDPGSACRTVETPGGQAKVIREEEDGEFLLWMPAYKLNVKVPADLVCSGEGC